ncbi:unnamed protein product [Adineta ricciae]|uniref:Uncharacterized protein n=1 Tax=Adineta ricciae TaxID=249248 RepID=A0A815XUE8_ADIRI|nr:unnamed protein product [Adineta ricciae]
MLVVFLLIVINGISAVSFNRPKFCPTVEWNRDATTFIKNYVLSAAAAGIFIDTNNIIYVAAAKKSQILVWHEDSTDPMTIQGEDWSEFSSMWVSNIGEIYISFSNDAIMKRIPSTNTFVEIVGFGTECTSLFIDIFNYLYCSSSSKNTVAKRWLDSWTKMVVVAGTGYKGSNIGELNDPQGIFVDINLDVYVADCSNDRIQLFPSDDKNGKIVAGRDSLDMTIALIYPHSVILDADKYLFISDSVNDRIVASGPNGFRCLVGCAGGGTESHQLLMPYKFHFDVHGNMFVCDKNNNRIQKFDLQKHSCKSVTSSIETIYSSVLTENHPMYSRTTTPHYTTYHYEAIEVIVNKTDTYTLGANSSIDLYGHLYKHYFDLVNPAYNLIAWYGKCCNKDQFRFTVELFINTKYILIVTTYNPNVTGPFSLTVLGSSGVRLKRKNIERSIESTYSSALTEDDDKYYPNPCDQTPKHYYEAMQIIVHSSGSYTFLSSASIDTGMFISIYEKNFYTRIPFGNLLIQKNGCNLYDSSEITIELLTNMRVFGQNSVSFRRINASLAAHSHYSSQLTKDNQKYDKDCIRTYYYYETVRLTVFTDAYYTISTGRDSYLNIYMYGNHFDPLNKDKNLILKDKYSCAWEYDGEYMFHLRSDISYILLMTTSIPLLTTPFSIDAYGPTNFTLQRIIDNSTYCYVGGPCNTQVKSIGLTLDDILRFEVNRNMTIQHQPLLIKVTAALSVIMFVVGLISSACSILTFQNASLRQVGCGLYLLASSVTSLLTITIFTIKFWFVVITQMGMFIRPSILDGGCKSIEPILKLLFYWDTWLNACVAVERGVNVYKGVNFDKEKSKRFARWIIFILPIVIVGTIIHEPFYRHVFKHEIKERSLFDGTTRPKEIVKDIYTWCLTSYPQSVQDYNTAILFIHLLGPFLANLFSALFIIIGSARRRAKAQRRHTYRQHLRDQWNEHKQLIVSPVGLLLLSAPRLIIALLSGCTDVSGHLWLYVCGYFVSFTPSLMIFVVFVLPSNSYRIAFKESFFRLCKRRRL